jgi:hypothetical protein
MHWHGMRLPVYEIFYFNFDVLNFFHSSTSIRESKASAKKQKANSPKSRDVRRSGQGYPLMSLKSLPAGPYPVAAPQSRIESLFRPCICHNPLSRSPDE